MQPSSLVSRVLSWSVGAVALLAVNPAHAVKDWNLTEAVDPYLQTDVCRASTTIAKSTLPVELVVAFPKASAALPILYVKIQGLANKAPHAMIRFAKKEFQPLFLFKSAQTPEESDVYWYAPTDFKRLLSLVKGADSIDIAFDSKSPAPVPVQFSLKGSSATLEDTEDCLDVKDLLPEEFLKALNEEVEFNGSLPVPNVELLFGYVQQAYKDYLSGQSAGDALAALRKAMRPLVKKETDAKEVLDSKQSRLDKTNAALIEVLGKITTAEQDLAGLNSALGKLQSEKTAADQDLVAKKAIYDPAKAQITPFEKEVSAAERQLSSIRQAIADVNQQISNSEAAIVRLGWEASDLKSKISNLESQIRSLEWEFDHAKSDLWRFNVDEERRKILQNDWRYQNLKNELPGARNKAQQLRSDLSFAESHLHVLESALQMCKSPGAPPDPNKCSSQQSAYNNAKSKVDSMRWDLNRAEDRIRSIESEMNSSEWSASNQAENEKRRLQNKVDELEDRIDRLEDDKDSAESRVRSIENLEIPNHRNIVSQNKAALPGLEKQKNSAQKELAAAEAKLEEVKTQIGFQQIEKNYGDAKTLVRTLAKAIEDKQEMIEKVEKSLAKYRPEAEELKAKSGKQTAERDVAKAAFDAIQTELAPQRLEEQKLVSQLDAAKAGLAENRALYQAMYDKLAAGI